MKSRRFISRFTPSRTAPEDLEAIFVQRRSLLLDTVERVSESAKTSNKHHMLFIGPRGSGKSHFITLLIHRVSLDLSLADDLRIAWLNEDETSTQVLDLLMRIYVALTKRYPSEFSPSYLKNLYGMNERDASSSLLQELLRCLENRCLLVALENLDELFKTIGEDGQRDLRALIQNHPSFCVAATAQSIFDGVQKRESPFFGFFAIEHLRPLSVNDAVELLVQIAMLNGDQKLARFLRTRAGRGRVRALHHLSGGNHRIYVTLSEFINRRSLESLVQPFHEMLDELTPYYQERIRWLAPQQRKIVETLCRQERPTPVKDISGIVFSTPQAVASQLKLLRELGYVESHSRGRESLYELKEPLMRLCIEVKECGKSEPIRLVVDFLRVWYDEQQLRDHLGQIPSTAPERAYLELALKSVEARRSMSKPSKALVGASNDLNAGRFVDVIQASSAALSSSSIASDELPFWRMLRGVAYERSGSPSQALEDYNQVVAAKGVEPTLLIAAFVNRAHLYVTLNQYDEALADYAHVIDSATDPGDRAMAYTYRGLLYIKMKQLNAALQNVELCLAIGEIPRDVAAMALSTRAKILKDMDRKQEAIEQATIVIKDYADQVSHSHTARSFITRATARYDMGQIEDAIEDCIALRKFPDVPSEILLEATVVQGLSLVRLEKYSEAIDTLRPAVEAYRSSLPVMGSQSSGSHHERYPASSEVLYSIATVLLGEALSSAGQHQEALDEYSSVSHIVGAADWARVYASVEIAVEAARLGRWDESNASLSRALSEGEAHFAKAQQRIPELIDLLLRTGLDEPAWSGKVSQLVSLCERAQALTVLGNGLVRSLKTLRRSHLSDTGLDAWRSVWSAHSHHEQLKVALRIFTVGVGYLMSKDRGVLLNLPKEERRVLVEALGLGEQDDSQSSDTSQHVL